MYIGFDFTHTKLGARKNRYESFKMKTRLFDFITDPKIEILAYVDCDILFTIQGCPTEFVQTGPSWNDYQIRLTKVARNFDDSLNGIHCGTMVIHREHSRDLLNIWRMELDRKSSEGMYFSDYILINPLHYHSYPLFNPPHRLSFCLFNPYIC
jgi:hypothetical protein